MGLKDKLKDGFFKAVNSETAEKAFDKFLTSVAFDIATGNTKGVADKISNKTNEKCGINTKTNNNE